MVYPEFPENLSLACEHRCDRKLIAAVIWLMIRLLLLTGWTSGRYPSVSRTPIEATRAIIAAIQSGQLRVQSY